MLRHISIPFVAASLAASAQAASWAIDKVDGKGIGVNLVAARTPEGNAILYGVDNIYYAWRDAGGWHEEALLDAVGECVFNSPGLATDAAGEPVVCFAYPASRELTLGRRGSSGWSREIVPGTDDVRECAIALDSAARPVVAFVDGAGVLRLARDIAGSWSIATIDATARVERPSLALDASDRAAVAYRDVSASDLRYAREGATGWTLETVDSTGDTGRSPSLALDAAGWPWIAYVNWTTFDLKVARYDGTLWILEDVEVGPSQVSASRIGMALDANGEPLVAYKASPDLRLARRLGGVWSSETVDTRCDLAAVTFDPLGRIVVVYTKFELGIALRQAVLAGSTWAIEPVASNAQVGDGPSLVLDPAGRPMVAYFESNSRTLRFARWDGTRFQVETVDPVWSSGRAASLAIDASGAPAIAYLNAGGDIGFARFDGASWQLEVVAVGSPNPTIDLVFDRTGFPAILIGGSEMRLARRDPSGWTTSTIGPYARYMALAIDADDRPLIAFDSGINELAIRRWDGSAWIDQTVATDRQGRMSLALDPIGRPALTYWDVHGDVRLLSWDGSAWQSEVVAFNTLTECDLAFDAAGSPWVAYLDGSVGKALVAHREAGAWVSEAIDPTADQGGNDYPSLVVGGLGQPLLAYQRRQCAGSATVAVASRLPDADQVYRGVVGSLATGWQDTALPLTAANDQVEPPFPAAVGPSGEILDPLISSAPLLLYRLLGPGDAPRGNRLKVTRVPGAVRIAF